MAQNTGFWHYVKAAFHLKNYISGLGHLPLNKLLLAGFAILGFGHPAFWLLGLAFEGSYLIFLPGSPRFQKWVDAMDLDREKNVSSLHQTELFAQLPEEPRRRYNALAALCSQILRQSGGGKTSLGAELQSGGLSQLLSIFFKLLCSQRNIKQILSQTSRREIEEEIAEIQEKIRSENDSSAVARSLKGTQEIQQRRLENLLKATENLKVTEAELQRIEKQVSLIAEETTVSGDPSTLSARLDGVVQSLQGTTSWMSEHDEFFRQLDDGRLPTAPLPDPRQMQKE